MRVRREVIVLVTLPKIAVVGTNAAVNSVRRAHTAAAMEQLSAQTARRATTAT